MNATNLSGDSSPKGAINPNVEKYLRASPFLAFSDVPQADLLNAQWVLQLGLLLTVPILCYLAVEHGISHSISKFIETFVTGSPFFFMFHMGTKAHYYDSTLK